MCSASMWVIQSLKIRRAWKKGRQTNEFGTVRRFSYTCTESRGKNSYVKWNKWRLKLNGAELLRGFDERPAGSASPTFSFLENVNVKLKKGANTHTHMFVTDHKHPCVYHSKQKKIQSFITVRHSTAGCEEAHPQKPLLFYFKSRHLFL